MMYKLSITIILLFLFSSLSAQILPKEGDTVNYRLAGFTTNEYAGEHYLLEIAPGTHTNEVEFRKNISITQTDTSNQIIATVPTFNTAYTWRMSTTNKRGKIIQKGSLHYFVTGSNPYTDTSRYRIKIIKEASHHKDLLIFFDDLKVLCDINGNVLWYLPNTRAADQFMPIRDLRTNAHGTITFMGGRKICEIDYNGNELFLDPEKVDSAHAERPMPYHHEFTRLENGNYMAATYELATINLGKDIDTSKTPMKFQHSRNDKGEYIREFSIGGLREFDNSGKTVWEWKYPETLKEDTTFIKRFPGFPHEVTPHMNSFYFDSKENNIYISYRNAHTVLKIKYPTGEVLAKYSDSSNFYGQHCVQKTSNGDIILFNNNFLVGKDTSKESLKIPSYVTRLKEGTTKDVLIKIWEQRCDLDTLTQPNTGTGGSVFELSDGCILASVGTAGRTFIVSPDKKIIWNSLAQFADKQGWNVQPLYRANYIENNQTLKKLLFSKTIQ